MKKGNLKTLPMKNLVLQDQVSKTDESTKGLNHGQITFSSAKVLLDGSRFGV